MKKGLTVFVLLFLSFFTGFSQLYNAEITFGHYFEKDDIEYWSIPQCAFRLSNGKLAAVIRPMHGGATPTIITYDTKTQARNEIGINGKLKDAYLNEEGEIELSMGDRFVAMDTKTEKLYRVFTGEEYFTYDKYNRPLPDSKYSVYTIDFVQLPEGVKSWWGMRVFEFKTETEVELQNIDFGYESGGTGEIEFRDIKTFKNDQYYLRDLNKLIKMNMEGMVQGTAKKDYIWIYDFGDSGVGKHSINNFHYDASTNTIVVFTSISMQHPSFLKYPNGFDQYHIHLINATDGKLKSTKSIFPQTDEFAKEKDETNRNHTFLYANQMVCTDTHFYILNVSNCLTCPHRQGYEMEIMKYTYNGEIAARYPLKTKYPLYNDCYKAGLFQLAENNFLVWYWKNNDRSITFYEVNL